MRDRFDKAIFITGFFIGIALGLVSLGLILLEIAPAFKGTKL